MQKCKRYIDYVCLKERAPQVLALPPEAGQELDVRVVCTGNVSFSRLAGRAGAGLYSRILQQQTVGAGELYYFSLSSSPYSQG